MGVKYLACTCTYMVGYIVVSCFDIFVQIASVVIQFLLPQDGGVAHML